MISNLVRKKISRISTTNSVFFQCDIQGVFEKLVHKMPIVVKNTERMAKAAGIFGIPLLVTEQTPDKLGHTLESIQKVYPPDTPVIHKTSFSMMNDEVTEYFKSLNRDTVVLYGIEAHVCVQQTALDLSAMGVKVHLITDCVSSTCPHKRATAIKRMTQAGVYMTTFEACMFEIMRDCNHEKFKDILKHVLKDNPKDTFEVV
ncbi:unnamed protein product [Moneuplotes crassus]|uniref:Isochorismatase-like domain-containing protein n=1 Tax=Euplotes crassus TaxID=5936 RepID=A0AAD2D6G1_EUPCR|nr:unnamed protein product [Moneuplotes crassus]